MRTLRAFSSRLGGLFRPSVREREMAAEFESHLQMHIDDNLRAGMTTEQARREARLQFGAMEAIKGHLPRDFRYILARNAGS